MEAERPVEAPSVGVGEQFRRVETGASRGFIWSRNAKTVARAGAKPLSAAEEDTALVAHHRDAEDLAITFVYAQGRALGVGQREGRLQAARRDG